ncbi:MAG: pectin esterase [Prevotella sp.]|nr:pectin esterase [Prevotella sp.]
MTIKHRILLSAILLAAVTTAAAAHKAKGGNVFHAVVAQDGTGDYLTVQAAIDAAPEGRTEPWRIYIKEGIYQEHVDIPESKPYLSLIGEGRQRTQISCDRLCGGPNGMLVDEGATVTAGAANLYFEGINFVNSYGHEQKDGPQALALYTKGDRVVLNRCGLLSFQDTWLTPYGRPNQRNYAVDCFIEGAVDFIYGQGNIFFDHDTLYITRKTSGYIVAPNHHPDTEWGYVFRDNVITAPGDAIETQVYLGRPWHGQPKVAFINTKAEVTIYESGWRNHMGGLPVLFAEYGTTDWQGHPLDLSKRCSRYWVQNDQRDTVWCTSKAVITADEAALYTVDNVLSGTDQWQPRQVMTACDAPVVGTVGRYLTWQPVAGAVGYVVTVNGRDKKFTSDCRFAYNNKKSYRVQSVSRWGALSE